MHEKEAEILRAQATEIANDPITLQETKTWTDLNLARFESSIEFARALARTVLAVPFESLPAEGAKPIQQGIREIHHAFNQVRQLHERMDQNQIVAPLNAIEQKSGRVMPQMASVLTFLLHFNGQLDAEVVRLRQTVAANIEQLRKATQEAEQQALQAKEDISELMDLAAGRATDRTIITFGQRFDEQAKSHNRISLFWLGIAVALGAVTLYSAASLMVGQVLFTGISLPTPSGDVAEAIQSLGTKLVFLGLLASGTFWCTKNFRANQHLKTVNEHRANALRTFEIFRDGAHDPVVKDSVLVEATRAIFSQTDTGYLELKQGDTSIINAGIERMIPGRAE